MKPQFATALSGLSNRFGLSSFTAHMRVPLYRNSYALLASLVAQSGLGIVFWWAAARFYSTEAVGINAAAISAWGLLAGISQLSLLGTAVRYVPQMGVKTPRFIGLAYLTTLILGAISSLIFMLGLSIWAPELDFITASVFSGFWFVFSVMAINIFTIQDGILAGMRQMMWIPIENSIFGATKIILLVIFSFALKKTGIFFSWSVAATLLVIPINYLIFFKLLGKHVEETKDKVIPSRREIGTFIASNYINAILIYMSLFLLPLIIIAVAGATANAYFYMTWQIAGALQMVASCMMNSLIVEATREPAKLVFYTRRMMINIFRLIIPAVAVVIVAGPLMLRIFGRVYADEGITLLRLLAICAIPNVINMTYLTVARVKNQSLGVVLAQVGVTFPLLGLGYVFLKMYGLIGVGWAMLISQSAVALILLATEMRPIVFSRNPTRSHTTSERSVQKRYNPNKNRSNANAVEDSGTLSTISPTEWNELMMEVESVLASPIEKQPHRVPLRVGLIVDSFTQPEWVFKIINDIHVSTFGDIVLLIKDDAKRPYSEAGKALLPRAYLSLDRWLFKSRLTALVPRDLTPLVQNVPVLTIKPGAENAANHFGEENAAAISEYHLDVLLHFGLRTLKGSVLKSAKYGVWAYHHGNHLGQNSILAGIWEFLEGSITTTSVLKVLSNETEGHDLYRGIARTIPYSPAMNANNCYWTSVDFVTNKLRQLYELGDDVLPPPAEKKAFVPYFKPFYNLPTNQHVIRSWARIAANGANLALANMHSHKQWFLAYQICPEPLKAPPAFFQFNAVKPPKDRFWADPFPVKHEGRYYVFFEEYMYNTGKAHLSVIQVDGNGICEPSTKVLDKEYHLSYPFIFKWDGDYFMIPETGGSRSIQLYRCTSFPFEWKLEKVLMSGISAVDTTLMEIDGRWWMFTCIESEGVRFSGELQLFYADSPLGPWTAHPLNPVKSDVMNGRPAGSLFRWGNTLYRPAQNGSKCYGYAVSLNKVDRIDPNGFEETLVANILPEWNDDLLGVHTFNIADDFVVVDALKYRQKYR